MNENINDVMEMENEGINYDQTEETTSNGGNTGLGVIIGGALTLAAIGAVKLGKKLYDNFKAKKEAKDDMAVEVLDLNDDEVYDSLPTDEK